MAFCAGRTYLQHWSFLLQPSRVSFNNLVSSWKQEYSKSSQVLLLKIG